jgi:hypothetical protein
MVSNWYKTAQSMSDDELDAFIQEIDVTKWVSIDSSFISDVAYSAPTQMFEIRMKNGSEYTFSGVPEAIYQNFLDADSKGQFFNSIIKKRYKMSR